MKTSRWGVASALGMSVVLVIGLAGGSGASAAPAAAPGLAAAEAAAVADVPAKVRRSKKMLYKVALRAQDANMGAALAWFDATRQAETAIADVMRPKVGSLDPIDMATVEFLKTQAAALWKTIGRDRTLGTEKALDTVARDRARCLAWVTTDSDRSRVRRAFTGIRKAVTAAYNSGGESLDFAAEALSRADLAAYDQAIAEIDQERATSADLFSSSMRLLESLL